MVNSFTGYGGDDFHVVSNSKVQIWQQKSIKFGGNSKNSWTLGTWWCQVANKYQAQW